MRHARSFESWSEEVHLTWKVTKNWAEGCRKTDVLAKILRTLLTSTKLSKGTHATRLLCGRIPGGVNNVSPGMRMAPANCSRQKHSHQTHMIENSCEIPCCLPITTKKIRRVDESDTWRMMVSRCSEDCSRSNSSGEFKKLNPELWRSGRPQLNHHPDPDIFSNGWTFDGSQSRCLCARSWTN